MIRTNLLIYVYEEEKRKNVPKNDNKEVERITDYEA
jgi:hypothetical protein